MLPTKSSRISQSSDRAVTWRRLASAILIALATGACAAPAPSTPSTVETLVVAPANSAEVTGVTPSTETPTVQPKPVDAVAVPSDQVVATLKESAPRANTTDVGPPQDRVDDLVRICNELRVEKLIVNESCNFIQDAAATTTYAFPNLGALFQMISLDMSNVDNDDLAVPDSRVVVGGLLAYQSFTFTQDIPPDNYIAVVNTGTGGFELISSKLEPIAQGKWVLRKLETGATPNAVLVPGELCYSQPFYQNCLEGDLRPQIPGSLPAVSAALSKPTNSDFCSATLRGDKPKDCMPSMVLTGVPPEQEYIAPMVGASDVISDDVAQAGTLRVIQTDAMDVVDEAAVLTTIPIGTYRVNLFNLGDLTNDSDLTGSWIFQFVNDANNQAYYAAGYQTTLLGVPVAGEEKLTSDDVALSSACWRPCRKNGAEDKCSGRKRRITVCL